MEDRIEASPLHIWTEHCRKGELAYQVCLDDDSAVFYPRVVSPGSGSRNLAWCVSGGCGTVYAATTVVVKDEPPYNVALVDLDEGFRMMSRIEGIAPEQVAIGMRVRVDFRSDTDAQPPYPVFLPKEGRQ